MTNVKTLLDRVQQDWDENYPADKLPPFEELSAARAALATAKIPAALEWIKQYQENSDKPLIVFSAHRAPVETISDLEGFDSILGGTPVERRTQLVEDFQAGKLKGLAITIKAGGEGLTLTAADHALFVDLEWNPAKNRQAEDRIHRIGQRDSASIVVLEANHEIDRRLCELLQHKQDLFDKVIGAASVEEKLTQQEIVDKVKNQEVPEDEPKKKEPFIRYAKLIQHMVDARAKGLKWPKITLRANGQVVQLSLTGDKAKRPGTINLSNGEKFGSPKNKYYGAIGKDGKWFPARNLDAKTRSAVVALLDAFQRDPSEIALKHSHDTGYCCFCGILIGATGKKESVLRGYGPKCAQNWGLPFDFAKYAKE